MRLTEQVWGDAICLKKGCLLWTILLIVPSAVFPVESGPEQAEEEVFELSPYVVKGEDVGYRSITAMLGWQLKTDLRNLGSSITIVNEAFMRDTGAQNMEDILVLTPNTEIGGLGGNFSASQVNVETGLSNPGVPIPEWERDNHSGGVTRIRGLIAADLTRDFFATDVPFDTYNIERIAIQRGANNALFGLGSPGGVVNARTRRADFLGNRGQIKLKTDQYGTQRSRFRYNYEVIDDTLALLVAGLYDDKRYEQKQAFELDKRIYGSVMWNITKHIRLHISGEKGEQDGAPPDYYPLNDAITPWILAGKPVSDNPRHSAELYRGKGTFFPPEAANSLNNRLLGVDPQLASSGFVEYFHDVNNPDSTFNGTPFVRRNRGTPDNTEFMRIRVRPMIRSMKLSRGWWPGGGSVAPGTSGFYSGGNVDLQILDRSIFDYRKNLFSGGASTLGSDWEVIQGSLEGIWWDNRFGVELAAFQQDMHGWGFNMLQGNEQRSIYIDINKSLMAQDGSGNWLPNPAFGQLTMGGGYGGHWLPTSRETLRVRVFAELQADDFTRKESWLSQLLGTFTATAAHQEQTHDRTENYGGRGGLDPQAVADGIAGGDIFALHKSGATFRKGMQFTLPSKTPIKALMATSLDAFRGAQIGAVPFGRHRDRPTNPQTYVGWDAVSKSFTEFTAPVTTLRDLDGPGFFNSFYSAKKTVEVDSKVLIGQWFLWDDLIVLTGTWRNDRERSGFVNAPRWEPYSDGRSLDMHEDTRDPAYSAGVKERALDADEETTSWSIVIHSPEFVKPYLPKGVELSLHRSKSENFTPGHAGRVDVYNRKIGPQIGNTEELGFTLSAMNGKFLARANWFETSILKQSFSGGGISATEGILLNLVRQLDNPDNIAQGFTAADAQAVLPPQSVLDLNGFDPDWENADAETDRNVNDTGMQDYSAEGMEIEVYVNPTPRWTILATVARQETVKANINPVMTRYVNEFVIPVWINTAFAQHYLIDDDSAQTLAERAQTSIVDSLIRAKTEDGIPSIEQRKWRWTVNTSVNFGRDSDLIPSWLGDLTIGGGVRWEDRVGIGFAVGENALGEPALDTDQPFYGPSQTFIDVFARSEFELTDTTNLIVQINIKDLMDNDDLIPFFAEPNGMRLYRFMEGRLITASVALSF